MFRVYCKARKGPVQVICRRAGQVRSGRLDEVKSGQAKLDEVKFYSRELMLDG